MNKELRNIWKGYSPGPGNHRTPPSPSRVGKPHFCCHKPHWFGHSPDWWPQSLPPGSRGGQEAPGEVSSRRRAPAISGYLGHLLDAVSSPFPLGWTWMWRRMGAACHWKPCQTHQVAASLMWGPKSLGSLKQWGYLNPKVNKEEKKT